MRGDQKKDLEHFKWNPKLLNFFYLDPKCGIQSLFMRIDIIRWFHHYTKMCPSSLWVSLDFE
jgi:hypothetical protein